MDLGEGGRTRRVKPAGGSKGTTVYEGVVFIPHTPNSNLQRALQARENQFSKMQGIKPVRFVEKLGQTLRTLVCRANPWRGKHCKREDCFICNGAMEGPGKNTGIEADPKDLGRCQDQGLVYSIHCVECLNRGDEVHYIGESGRTAYQGGVEHLRGLRDQVDTSPLWKHQVL